MNWLSDHLWLLFSIGGATLIAVIFLLQRLFISRAHDTDEMDANIRDSQVTHVGFQAKKQRQSSKKLP